jgi:hypothetical protein
MLTEFVQKIDEYTYVNSNNLIEIRLTSDVPISDFVMTNNGGLANSILALADQSATYINSEYFVGTQLKKEKDEIIRTDYEY